MGMVRLSLPCGSLPFPCFMLGRHTISYMAISKVLALPSPEDVFSEALWYSDTHQRPAQGMMCP